GMWQMNTCTGTGACANGSTQACNTYGTETCGSNCQWGGCSCPAGSTVTFNYEGAAQSFVVPPCITTVTITAYGAQGGSAGTNPPGKGASVTTTIATTPGETLVIYVGGQGGARGSATAGAGGSEYGGIGGSASASGGGGGGSSDVR